MLIAAGIFAPSASAVTATGEPIRKWDATSSGTAKRTLILLTSASRNATVLGETRLPISIERARTSASTGARSEVSPSAIRALARRASAVSTAALAPSVRALAAS